MRRALVLAAVLLLAGAGVAAATAPGLTQQSIPKYGISVQVPVGWVGRPGDSQAAYYAISTSPHNGFSANLNLIVDSLRPGQTLRQWMVGASPKALRVGTLRQVTIGGLPALEYESTKLIAIYGRQLLTLEYAFARSGRVYLFTYTSLAGDRARFEGVMKASAKTIRFSGQTA
jgi:hypothetical protein